MLVVFGAINIDMVFPVAVLPKAGETIRSASGWNHSGGKAGNQAVAAARDGGDVHLVGAVGNDPLADLALTDLAREGLQLRNVIRRSGVTGRAVVCVTPDGKSMVVADVGANREALAAQVGDTLLGPRTTLLVQLDVETNETAALIARARRKNTRIILNLSPARVINIEALRTVDLLVGNTEELAWLGEHLGTGNNPASLRAALGIDTVRMMGVQGAEAAWQEGFVSVAANPVERTGHHRGRRLLHWRACGGAGQGCVATKQPPPSGRGSRALNYTIWQSKSPATRCRDYRSSSDSAAGHNDRAADFGLADAHCAYPDVTEAL